MFSLQKWLTKAGPVAPVAPSAARAPILWRLEESVCSLRVDAGSRLVDEKLTLAELLTGILIFGATGSGKTSGTAEHFSIDMMRYGFGGLVLCAKPEEAEQWRQRAEVAGRAGDMIFFSPENPYRFNPLAYEASVHQHQEHGYTEDLLKLLLELCDVQGDANTDPYWPQNRNKVFINTLDLMQLAAMPISFDALHTTILSLATPEGYEKLLARAAERVRGLPESRQKDYLAAQNYFVNEWKLMPEKTRESVKSTATNVLAPFTRGIIRELFSGETNVTPEDCGRGKIIVIDLPAITLLAGKNAAVVWKYLFQSWSERRAKTESESRPVFLFADECQHFATARDAVFQSTARSARVSTVYLTQNYGALRFNGHPQYREYRESLLANLVTKIFHQNADAETNEWAARAIGKDLQTRKSSNYGSNQSHQNSGGGGSSFGTSTSQQYDFEFSPIGFQNLLTGGHANNRIVTAVLFCSGRRRFANGKLWAEIAFRQTKLP